MEVKSLKCDRLVDRDAAALLIFSVPDLETERIQNGPAGEISKLIYEIEFVNKVGMTFIPSIAEDSIFSYYIEGIEIFHDLDHLSGIHIRDLRVLDRIEAFCLSFGVKLDKCREHVIIDQRGTKGDLNRRIRSGKSDSNVHQMSGLDRFFQILVVD